MELYQEVIENKSECEVFDDMMKSDGFYDATSAKKCARNKSRIMGEISSIQNNIVSAIDDKKFECDVYNTVMTDDREYTTPIKEAIAHCHMELSKVSIHSDINNVKYISKIYGGNSDDEKYDVSVYCGGANILNKDVKNIAYCGGADEKTINYDVYNCGHADIGVLEGTLFCGHARNSVEKVINCGYSNGSLVRPNYFKVGEILNVKDRNDVNPIEFKITEINKNGEIVDLEITKRGEFTNDIFDKAFLDYKDKENWLDVDSNYGIKSDLRIGLDNKVMVKDITNGVSESLVDTWYPINRMIDINTLPLESFGIVPDAFIKHSGEIYIKTDNGWFLSNKIYDYVSFRLPNSLGLEKTAYYNVFGKNYIKTKCGWFISPTLVKLGDVTTEPNPQDYNLYDIVWWNKLIMDDNGNVTGKEYHKSYKSCSNYFTEIISEYDWTEKPCNLFGKNMDLFIYPEGNYRVKINDEWQICPNEWRYDQIYLNDEYGDIHDVIAYSGELEPYTTYVKMGATFDKPKGHWVQVQKVWDLNKYKLGRVPVKVDLLWTVKDIIIDEKGLGYAQPTSIVFSDGDASAVAKIIDGKIVEISLTNKGDDYIITPEVEIVMNAPVLSKEYYKVWKRMKKNNELQDEMDKVIQYFSKNKKMSIIRVKNPETNNTFYWHLQWN